MRNQYRKNQRWRRICPALAAIHTALRSIRAMRRTALFLLLLTVQATALAGITIEVPAEPVAVGDVVDIPITGIDPAMQAEAEKTLRCTPVASYFKSTQGWGNQLGVSFMAKTPGKYNIHVTSARLVGGAIVLDYAEVTVVVGGEPEPDPNPTPPPVPPVPVPGEVSMAVILETGTRTADESEILGKLRAYLRTSKLKVEFADQHMVDGKTKRTPDWLIPYLKAVTTRPVTLPVLVVLAPTQPSSDTPHERTREAFSVVAVEELRDGDQAVALVKKWGAK